MDEQAKEIARRAAGRLAAGFGPALPALVERELQNPNAGPQRYTGIETVIALAALLVSAAQFVWQVYHDLSKDGVAASPEGMARQVRLKLEMPAQVTAADRDHLITVVVEEMLVPARKVEADHG